MFVLVGNMGPVRGGAGSRNNQARRHGTPDSYMVRFSHSDALVMILLYLQYIPGTCLYIASHYIARPISCVTVCCRVYGLQIL
jgi:hypothetical protein